MNKKAKTATLVTLAVILMLSALFVLAAKPQCNDRIDNDGDGLIDYPADPGCAWRGDNDEFNPPTTTTTIPNNTTTTSSTTSSTTVVGNITG